MVLPEAWPCLIFLGCFSLIYILLIGVTLAPSWHWFGVSAGALSRNQEHPCLLQAVPGNAALLIHYTHGPKDLITY